MASAANGACGTCGQPATLQCSRCAEGVAYDGSPSPNIYYCSSACQKADFPAHKGGCKQSQQRKVLYRAAEEMQACFYVVQRVAFTVNIAEVSVLPDTGKLRVIEAAQTGERAPFPDHKFTDIDEQAKLNLLATISIGTDHMEANMNALRYMKRDPALKDIAESATAIEYVPSPHTRTVEFVRATTGSRVPDLIPTVPHIVLRLQLGKESYALDLAGAEVGITQPIVPWKIYDKVLGNMFVTMKSSVMIGVWTKNAEERMVTKSHHSFNTMQLSGVTDTGMSYFRLMQAQTYEEVQDLVLAKGTATYAAILGGKREGFARFLSDVLQTFETRLNELEASPSGQHWSGFPLSQEKVSQKMHALSPEQRKKFEAARAAMFPGLEHLYTR